MDFLERIKNFFMHGLPGKNEDIYFDKKDIRSRSKKELDELKPIDVTKEERKAIMLAALQVFGPLVLILLAVVFLLLFITAKYF